MNHPTTRRQRQPTNNQPTNQPANTNQPQPLILNPTGADTPAPPPPPPPPVPKCANATVAADGSGDLLVGLARNYNLSVAQIMIDNGLKNAFNKGSGPGGKFVPGKDKSPVIKIGTKLKLNCPTGTWSPPLGTWNGGSDYQVRAELAAGGRARLLAAARKGGGAIPKHTPGIGPLDGSHKPTASSFLPSAACARA